MSEKFYAVANGRSTGIFLDHDAWKEATFGFKGNEFKICKTLEEAQAFLEEKGVESKIIDAANPSIIEHDEPRALDGKILPPETTVWERLAKGDTVVFTDGSYSSEAKRYGCGAVVIYPDGAVEKFSFSGDVRGFLEYDATSGELMAAIMILNHLAMMSVKSVTVFYDYERVAGLALSSSKPKKGLTQFYKKAIREQFLPKMQVSFIHVKGHSGHRFNELADQLAKKTII